MRFQAMAGIVTYNPDPDDLSKSVPALVQQLDRLVIVDNGSDNLPIIRDVLKPFPQVFLIENEKNEGIAKALNQIFTWGRVHGYTWILTLDDDSEIPPTMMKEYEDYLEGCAQNVGIVCPLLKNRRDKVVFHSKRSEDECITSGSLTRVAAWEVVGGFDEWLFIDGVDFDFSRRMVRAGYEIHECTSVVMPHQIGQSRSINVLGRHPIIWNHSASRQFYIQRNSPYIDFKLGTYSPIKARARFLKDLVFILIWEDEKWAKISAMVRGWRAGMRKIRQMHSK